jgi:hypothetical protein
MQIQQMGALQSASGHNIGSNCNRNAASVMFHATDAVQLSLAVKAFMWAVSKVLFRHPAIDSWSTMVCSLGCRHGSRSGVLIIHANSTLYFLSFGFLA